MAIKHGLANTPEYEIWNAMLERCNNENCSKYEYIGGRGITVCEAWSNIENFYADLGPRPSPDMILTRLDPDGDFTPENCVWAPYGVAQHNNKLTSNNTSGVKGVFATARGKYQARIGAFGKVIYLGTYDTLDEAAAARVAGEKKYW